MVIFFFFYLHLFICYYCYYLKFTFKFIHLSLFLLLINHFFKKKLFIKQIIDQSYLFVYIFLFIL